MIYPARGKEQGGQDMAGEGLAARMAAVTLLGDVLEDGALLGQALAEPQGALTGLTPSDKARAQRLALTTLRHIEQADKVLKPHLRKEPGFAVRNVLRLAVVEMAVDKAAAHGVVNAAVSLMRMGKRTTHMAGLVNAVLRKVAEMPEPFAGLPAQRLPFWLRKPLVDVYGREAVTAMEAVQARSPSVDITMKPGAVAETGAEVLPTGSLRLAAGVQVSNVAGFAEGAWWVQDAAAALAVPLLGVQARERVLDICAAPGGKTLQLAAAGADVVALDISEPRLARLRENLARTGLSATVIAADALVWEPEGKFDAILLDAPCSATGTIRRHPDLPFVKDGSDLSALTELQAQLIDRALGWLKPGGRMVFCTCSLLPEEGEAQLAAALARHPWVTVVPPNVPGMDASWVTEAGGLRLRPDYWADIGGMDGFFMAKLQVPQ